MNKLDKYFLETEGLTYQGFCDLYNNSQPLMEQLEFITIPDNILKLSKKVRREQLISKMPEKLKRFLEDNNSINFFIKYWHLNTDEEYLERADVFYMMNTSDMSNYSYNKWIKLKNLWRTY